eukprot:2461759-Rhodomonas_salina.3
MTSVRALVLCEARACYMGSLHACYMRGADVLDGAAQWAPAADDGSDETLRIRKVRLILGYATAVLAFHVERPVLTEHLSGPRRCKKRSRAG